MNTEPNAPNEIKSEIKSVLAELDPEPKALSAASSEIKQETEALLDAIRQRAEQEMQAASDFTRDAYLKVVRQAREAIEDNKLVDAQRIEDSIEALQKEVEHNIQNIMNEVTSFSDRLSDAARAAWEKLTDEKKS